jgi:integrase/recombinase XerC
MGDMQLATLPEAFERLAAILKAELSEQSRVSYGYDLDAFARWMGAFLPNGRPDREGACRALILAGKLGGTDLVARFFMDQTQAQKSPATLKRRLACLSGIVRKARIMGLCEWTLEIRGPKVIPYRDTRGPEAQEVHALVKAAFEQKNPAKAARDVAMLRLLYEQVRRRNEVCTLRLEDLELNGDQGRVWILGKGKQERVPKTLSPGGVHAMREWLRFRGEAPGPLFFRLDHARPAEPLPLTGYAIWLLCRELALMAGLRRIHPHALRHSGITRALDRSNGDVRAAKQLSDHSKYDTLMIYDHNRRDLAGNLSALLAEDLDSAVGFAV